MAERAKKKRKIRNCLFHKMEKQCLILEVKNMFKVGL